MKIKVKGENNEPIKAALLGAGNRGMTIYGKFALQNPDKLNFVAVAEPIDHRRSRFAQLHDIPNERRYLSWKDLLGEEKLSDLIFVCTQDQMHIEPTILALEKGYDVLLEKPMAHTLEGCVQIAKKVEETGRILGVAHVLRYTDFFSKIYGLIRDKKIGDIINISHRENLAWYHMAHSYVRGNWNNREGSSPMILAKCCHDLDLLFWLIGFFPKRISSFGSLKHFKKENAPKNAPLYCLDGCPVKNFCLYYAPRIYVDIEPILQIMKKSDNNLLKRIAKLKENHPKILKFLSRLIPDLKELLNWTQWPVEPLYHGHEEEYSKKNTLNILKTSDYGKCVYHSNNDVVDHQIVSITFENDVTACLTMHGFSEREGRTLRIDGTRGTILGEFHDSGEKITLYDHYTGEEEVIFERPLQMEIEAHGGGDFRFIASFLDLLKGEIESKPLTSAKASLESHLMAFAAEKSRLNGIVIKMDEFRKESQDL